MRRSGRASSRGHDDLRATAVGRRLDLASVAKTLRATTAEVGTAACSKVRFAGLRECVRSGTRVLGERAVAGAEDGVARLKLRHVLADRLDCARDIPGLARRRPDAYRVSRAQ